jgi:hypothetical protein
MSNHEIPPHDSADEQNQAPQGYYARNQRWLNPLFGIAAIACSQLVLQIAISDAFVDGKPVPLPNWSVNLAAGGISLGCFVAGFAASTTDTFSARIARTVLMGLAIGVILAITPFPALAITGVMAVVMLAARLFWRSRARS